MSEAKCFPRLFELGCVIVAGMIPLPVDRIKVEVPSFLIGGREHTGLRCALKVKELAVGHAASQPKFVVSHVIEDPQIFLEGNGNFSNGFAYAFHGVAEALINIRREKIEHAGLAGQKGSGNAMRLAAASIEKSALEREMKESGVRVGSPNSTSRRIA